MNARDVIQTSLNATKNMVDMYLADLSDADLLVRPVPVANHIAWQLGHLISSEPQLVKMGLPDAAYPTLPSGFAETHAQTAATTDSSPGFKTKAEYLDLFGKVRSATIAALAKLSDADLDRPTEGRMAKFAPTLGALFVLTSNHTLMHAGQFTVVRRKLGKPILF
ncbi:MAG TPA: DinB family protein [Gemmataceae bacterium]|nr:DinB family protein [Gemmataceae bacterium]